MASAFTPATEIERLELDWGVFAPVSSPATGAERIMAIEATFLPGKCHDFHRHPNQEEVIYVLEGSIEQWIGQERRDLGPGDGVVIEAGEVHGSFNTGSGQAKILAILSPCVGADGYELEDMSGEQPWASLRT